MSGAMTRAMWKGKPASDVQDEFRASIRAATLDHAWGNMETLLQEVGAPVGSFARDVSDPGDGYWSFIVTHAGHEVRIALPGVPLSRLRSPADDEWPMKINVDEHDGNASNWSWPRAVEVVAEAIGIAKTP